VPSILIISEKIPSPEFASTTRTYHAIKHLFTKYKFKITLVSLSALDESPQYLNELKGYCEDIHIVDQPQYSSNWSRQRLFYAAKEFLPSLKIKSLLSSITNVRYSLGLQRKIEDVTSKKKFDLIYCNCFALYFSLPKTNSISIFDAQSVESVTFYQMAKVERNLFIKLIYLLQSYKAKYYENKCLLFDNWICICSADDKILKSRYPFLKTYVIPFGIDVDYYKSSGIYKEEIHSLAMIASMNVPHNIHAALHFCNNIYPIVRSSFQDIKFYIVGRNPPPEILSLANTSDIFVTGYVNDIRPYLEKATLVVIPQLAGTGTKVKVLEAMAMGKPIISTSIGVSGLDYPIDDSIIIAYTPKKFANSIIELLNNEKLRLDMRNKSISYIESHYSLNYSTEQLGILLMRLLNM